MPLSAAIETHRPPYQQVGHRLPSVNRTTAEPGSIDHEYNRRSYHLRRLGMLKRGGDVGEAYEAYCQSEHWSKVRDRWRSGPGPHRCYVCGDPRYQLHHATYARLGFEEPEDLVPLCDRHHQVVSSLINVYRYTLPWPMSGSVGLGP